MSKYTLETIHQIWNDDTGERVEVGPSPDVPDLVEIRYRSTNGTIGARITLTQQELPLLIQALSSYKKEVTT